MVFLVDIAFAMEIIALAFGAAIIVFVKKNNKLNLGLSKFVGYAVMILAVLSMACTTFYGTKYWFEGYYKKPFVIKHKKHRMWHHKAKDTKREKKHKSHDKY